MKTAVAILNWNGQQLLEKFLPDVIAHTAHLAEIVVIDNGSTDNSVSWVEQNHGEVTIVKNGENKGFSSGYNSGLKAIECDLFILLNSDVQVTPGWIEPLIAVFSNELTAAAQPKILSYNQPTHFEYAGASGGYIDRDGFVFCRGRIFDSYEQDTGQYDTPTEVFWATGACLAVRSEQYWELGGLDEDFFAHMEEIDLCWRLKNAGWKIMVAPASTVYHVGGGTLNKINPQKTFLNFRNNLFLLLKNYRTHNVYLKLFQRLLLDGLAALKFLFQGQFVHFWAVFRAHLDFYRHFGRFRSKRHALAASINAPNHHGLYRKSVVWNYFVGNKKKFSALNPEYFR